WAADFTVDTLGYYVFTIEAWVDRFATWRDGLSKKYGAGQDVTLELREGLAMLAESGDAALVSFAARIERAGDQGAQVAAALAGALADAARASAALRRDVVRYARTPAVMVERERARFGAWYEMFPRSA